MSDLYQFPLPRYVFRIFAIVVVIFLVAPTLVIIPVSFSSGSIIAFPLPGFSLSWYGEAVHSPQWRDAVFNSLVIGISSALLGTILGVAGALGLGRLTPRLKSAVTALTLLPFVVPIILVALGGYLTLSMLNLNNTYLGVIIFHAMLGLPYVFISVTVSLEGFDRNLWLAATGLGASPVVAFRRIVLPIILPGVVTGAVFSFATSLDEVVVASFITGPTQRTLPLKLFAGIKENTGPIVTAIATLLLVLAVLLLVCVELLRRRTEKFQPKRGNA